ncbi:MAG: ATP-binding protein [Bacteroidetes bacterium]|nr:ATP-binding protein [Bacteroidota bacterium]
MKNLSGAIRPHNGWKVIVAENNVFTLNIPSRTDNLEIIRDFVITIARKQGFSEDSIGEIELAVDEACANVIKHAYHFKDDKEIAIQVETDEERISITISDEGQGFDPSSLESPEERLQKHARGGLGIALIRKVMDEVTFNIHPGNTHVRMVKYIPQAS